VTQSNRPLPHPKPSPQQPQMQPGWYLDHQSGMNRYWDGHQWTSHTAPLPAQGYAPQGYAPQGYVPVQPNVRQSRDRAQYVRQQTGHSIIKHVLFGWALLWIPTIYYAVSPNHYFHA
jgi:hypothetical protein